MTQHEAEYLSHSPGLQQEHIQNRYSAVPTLLHQFLSSVLITQAPCMYLGTKQMTWICKYSLSGNWKEDSYRKANECYCRETEFSSKQPHWEAQNLPYLQLHGIHPLWGTPWALVDPCAQTHRHISFTSLKVKCKHDIQFRMKVFTAEKMLSWVSKQRDLQISCIMLMNIPDYFLCCCCF